MTKVTIYIFYFFIWKNLYDKNVTGQKVTINILA